MISMRSALAALCLCAGASGFAVPKRVTAPSSRASRHSRVRCAETVGVKRFLGDLEFLGPTRFVVVGTGAILEAVGSFENLRVKEIPDKGPLVTVSSEDNDFECHLRCRELKQAHFVTKAKEDRTMYIIRLVGADETTMLSAILHAEGGEYEEGAVEFWTQLRDRFGEVVTLSADE